MKTIKIFLASSEELENDRNAFGNLVRRLDNIYEKRGFRVELCPWEDLDAAYNDRRKQDEYNDHVRSSDLFLALFHIKAGKFTIEEFDVATEEFRKKGSPKVYVYCKDLKVGEVESQDLKDFKARLSDELGHYWCRYGNRDTMQLHFVMQLQLVENNRMEKLKVEKNGEVTFEGMTVAHMDKLPFAAANEAYQRMNAELLDLPDEIDKARQRVEKYPDDIDLRYDLQKKFNRYNQLKEDFAKLQQDLFATAKTIADLQHQQVNVRLRRAIEAFECGNLERANILLEENEREGDLLADNIDRNHKRLRELIDSLLLETKTVMANVTIPIDDRIIRVAAIYSKADHWATLSAYEKEKYVKLLFDYSCFLYVHAYYDEAATILHRQIILSEEVYGVDSTFTATSYINLAVIYEVMNETDKTLENFFKALSICEKVLGAEHSRTAGLYKNIALIYTEQNDFDKAEKYYAKSIAVYEKLLNSGITLSAKDYNSIGYIYWNQRDYDKSIEYHSKALTIEEKDLGKEHPSIALSFSIIGLIYMNKGDFSKALECYFHALSIREKALGMNHPETAKSYYNIGSVCSRQGDFSKALEYYSNALAIYKELLNPEHPDIQMVQRDIEMVKRKMGL